MREHAKAASLFHEVVVLYAYSDPCPKPKESHLIFDEIEEGIRTIRIKYGGIAFSFLNKRVIGRQKHGDAVDSKSKCSIFREFLAIPWIVVRDFAYYWSVFSAFRKLLKEGWKPDVIHAHVFVAGVPAVFLGKLYQIPVVVHERWSGFPLRNLTLLHRLKAKFALNGARVILPTSHYLKRHIETYGIKGKFEVIPNAVNPGIFYPPLVRCAGEEDGRTRLLLVALLTPAKGVTYLLEALKKVRGKRQDFVLDIVGDGPNRNEYENLAGELGLGKSVRFLGLKPKEEVAQFMRKCDFFVMPSLQETFGTAYIEAMACGKPVIATNIGGPEEIVNHEMGIRVPPRDINALADAIEYMLDNYMTYSSMRIAEVTRERFSYVAVGKMLDVVYRTVLNREDDAVSP